MLYQRLLAQSRYQPRHCAIESEAGSLSYQQLLVLTDQCADYFIQRRLKQGDRVAVLALNHPDYFIALFACANLGLILVPLNWRLSVEELSYVIDDCKPELLLYDETFQAIATQLARDSLPAQRIGHAQFPPQTDPVTTDRKSFPLPHDDTLPLLIVYTSGTTGRPKGAVLSQRALLCSANMSQHMLDLNPADRVLNVLPLFHVGGLNIQPLPALLFGATLYLHARFDPQRAVDALITHRITLINSVPTVLQAMLSSSEINDADLSCLKAISIGSTDVPVSLIRRVHDLNIPLIQVYGATETSPVAIYQRVEHAPIEGSIGRAGLHCQIRLVGDSGHQVEPGQSGEILVKGDNILSRYWNNPGATEASIQDGWFATGDIAHQDEAGFYWFDDRVKHVVISGGENIYPAELERVIRELPGVSEVAVVGVPDDRWGEVPVAVVVSEAQLDPEYIITGCSALARFKRPHKIYFAGELPRNALGKVQVQEIKKLVEKLSGGAS